MKAASKAITVFALPTIFVFLVSTTQPSLAIAKASTGSIKGTVMATTGAANTRPAPISGARVTLVNRDLPSQSFKTVTDNAGNFTFIDLPDATYLLTVDADGLPGVRREIRLTAGATLTVEIELTATISESVTVRDEEGLLSTAETTTSNIVREQLLKDLPLRAENYQSSLALTPGVVRGNDGLDHLKGARAGQSTYTVNGVDVADPVTGNLAFDIPIEAAASVHVEENPYSAEFGRLTGGATNLETKAGTNKFKVTAARFFPTFRYILSGPVDSFRPRVTLSGPVIRDRLFFLQSLEYRFTRIRVPSIRGPRDDSTSQSFNSFTQFDFTLNKNNRVKMIAAFFPQEARYVGLNTFDSQQTTPNTRQRGSLFSVSEQAIFNDASFLSSALSYKTFDFYVYGQGSQPLTLLPDSSSGNYFADTRRQTRRFQWQETFYARPFSFHGQHSIKLGSEVDQTAVSARLRYQPILIRRSDGTLAQRIDFMGIGRVKHQVGELAAFVQDRWVAGQKLTVDAGLRYDRSGINRANNIAPRLSFMFLPFKDDRTIIRGGIGLFYGRTPFSITYFGFGNEGDEEPIFDSSSVIHLPKRVVTTYAADGFSIIDGPRRFKNIVEPNLRSPRSIRWSLQADRGLTKRLTARVGYLQRSTTDDLIINPSVSGSHKGLLMLGSHGRSQYRELQLLATYNNTRMGNWNASYVWSSARGDLNTVDNFLSDFPAYVVRPNEYGRLPFDAPHRFLVYGQWKTGYHITIAPSLEIRSGFPYSFVNEQLDFVGPRNGAGRLPTFISLDAQVTKGFHIPRFEKHRARIGVAIFNITNHFNPRDVQNNLGSPRFGQFFNSLGTLVRGKFELDF